jgi:hypothetical protein
MMYVLLFVCLLLRLRCTEGTIVLISFRRRRANLQTSWFIATQRDSIVCQIAIKLVNRQIADSRAQSEKINRIESLVNSQLTTVTQF